MISILPNLDFLDIIVYLEIIDEFLSKFLTFSLGVKMAIPTP